MLSKMSIIENRIRKDVKKIEQAIVELNEGKGRARILRRIVIAASFLAILIILLYAMK